MWREYFTNAIVLDYEPRGEYDARVWLFTERIGKCVARVVGTQRVASKLRAHLDPLSCISARLLDHSMFQVVDALRIGLLPHNPATIRGLHLIRDALPELVIDARLWTLLWGDAYEKKRSVDIREILKVFGFDPLHARCVRCSSCVPSYFSPRDLVYFCTLCALRDNAIARGACSVVL